MQEVINYIKNELDIKYGDVIVIGVSGGPDSMALLSILIELRKFLEIEIVCAHVNHNVREESDAEKTFLANFCKKHTIQFEDVKVIEYGDDNFHNEARTIRYKHFKRLVNKYKAKYLFTAHHGDDLIETVLMRIVRGSTLRGYSGFSKKITIDGYAIVRPLIGVSKDEIIAYNKQNNITYVTDGSNEHDVYTRNRFRKYIVSGLKREDAKVHRKFLKFSETLQEYNSYIDKIVEKKIKKLFPEDVLNIEKFLEEEKLIQMKVIYYILEKFYQDDLMLINDQHVNLIQNLLLSEKVNATIHLPNEINVVKAYNTLTLVRQEVKQADYSIELTDYVNLTNGKNIEKVSELNQDDNFVCRLQSSEVKMPLYVRNKKEGDKMTVKGMLGRKKITDIFIDNKIPLEERKQWPVVVDSADSIVWLPGLKKSKFNKEKKEKYDIILRYY